MKRRQLLQFTATSLGTIALSQLYVQCYHQALAQSKPGRKLALLIGINGYNKSDLKGCIMDVQMQRELLIYRYGFNPKDILILADDRSLSTTPPTRQNILQAIQAHLIDQAKPEDTVVLHYSGHGDRVDDPTSPGFGGKGIGGTLVPIDRQVEKISKQTIVSDITGKTLFLLLSQLKTENVTTILDCCYSGSAQRIPGMSIRSTDTVGILQYRSNPEELELQKQLQAKLRITDQALKERRKTVAKGIVMTACNWDELAAERNFGDYSCGIFSSFLTQSLWQRNEPLQKIFDRVTQNIKRSLDNQTPVLETKTTPIAAPLYNSPAGKVADAIITKVEKDQFTVWLGGLSPLAIRGMNPGAVLASPGVRQCGSYEITIQSRQGLEAIAQGNRCGQFLNAGTPVQEKLRVIPKDYVLNLGLYGNWNDRDRALVTQSLQELKRIRIAQEDIQYSLGRFTPDLQNSITKAQFVPPINSLGLFDQAQVPIWDSFGTADEPLQAALDRLKPRFRSYLSLYLLKQLLNPDSSQLKITATMKVGTETIQAIATRSAPQPIVQKNGRIQIPEGTIVKLEVTNHDDRNLYLTVLGISPKGQLVPVFPNQHTDGTKPSLILQGGKRTIPDQREGDQFELQESGIGSNELLFIASETPLTEVIKTLAKEAQRSNASRGSVFAIDDPSVLVRSIQADVDRVSRAAINPVKDSSVKDNQVTNIQDRAIVSDATKIAVLSIVYDVFSFMRN